MKKLFIRTSQPIVLELLGYGICILFLATYLKLYGYSNWESYVWGVIFCFLIGVAYKLIVAHFDIVLKFFQTVYEGITNALCRIGGKKGRELSNKERILYASLACTIFVPVAMAQFYTFPYLLETSFNMKAPLSHYASIPFSIMLFFIDRYFVISMGHKKPWHVVLIRLAFATIMGIAIAEPIVLKMYDQEIKEQLHKERAEKLKKINAEYEEAQNATDTKEKKYHEPVDAAKADYDLEVNTSIGNRIAGHGKEAGIKMTTWKNAEMEYAANKAPIIDAERKFNDSSFAANKEDFMKNQSYGYGAKQAALARVRAAYPEVNSSYWKWVIFLLLLDTMPVLGKLFTPKTSADRKDETLDLQEDNALEQTRIKNKYALFNLELNEALGAVRSSQLPDEDKERGEKVWTEHIERKHFGESFFYQNRTN